MYTETSDKQILNLVHSGDRGMHGSTLSLEGRRQDYRYEAEFNLRSLHLQDPLNYPARSSARGHKPGAEGRSGGMILDPQDRPGLHIGEHSRHDRSPSAGLGGQDVAAGQTGYAQQDSASHSYTRGAKNHAGERPFTEPTNRPLADTGPFNEYSDSNDHLYDNNDSIGGDRSFNDTADRSQKCGGRSYNEPAPSSDRSFYKGDDRVLKDPSDRSYKELMDRNYSDLDSRSYQEAGGDQSDHSFQESRLDDLSFQDSRMDDRSRLDDRSYQESRIDDPVYQDSRLDDRSYQESRLDDRAFQDSRLDDRSFQESRLDDRSFQESRMEGRRRLDVGSRSDSGTSVPEVYQTHSLSEKLL